MSLPAIFTMPAVGRSRPPRICSSVVLPDPEAPMIARRSPARTREIHALQHLQVDRPLAKRARDAAWLPSHRLSFMAPSFMSKGLGGQRARGAPRRVDSGQRRERQRHERHLQHVARGALRKAGRS